MKEQISTKEEIRRLRNFLNEVYTYIIAREVQTNKKDNK